MPRLHIFTDEAIQAAAKVFLLYADEPRGELPTKIAREILDAAINAKYECQTEARFWRHVDKTETCWLWTGSVTTNGYGTHTIKYPAGDRQAVRAHRYSWELENGPISDGMDIDHICHARLCVRPTHLRPATRKQNLEHRQGANSHSKSGVRGVHWAADKGMWRASVGHNGKNIYVGRFHDLAEAEAAVKAKRLELYTHNDLDRTA